MSETDTRTHRIKDGIAKLQENTIATSEPERACAAYVQEKSYRISAAVLSLCSLIEQGSAIRHTLETSALTLVKDASRSSVERTARTALLSGLRALHGELETAALAGRVAEGTAHVLSGEVVSLAEFMRDTGWAGAGVTLELSMLHTELDPRAFAPIHYPGTYETHKEHRAVPPQRTTAHADMSYTNATSETEKSHGGVKDTKVVRYVDKVQDVQKDRRATILALLQRKDRLTVKDVSAVIKDCSEKTIQRELLALVAQGVLVKEGERRWSTYRLA